MDTESGRGIAEEVNMSRDQGKACTSIRDVLLVIVCNLNSVGSHGKIHGTGSEEEEPASAEEDH